ncbi:MAG: methyltransferase domain-containing protein [Lentisphaeraceae bacterium]|nr:methyltransferase domain-containing protein [Lentisphaeraceae bacterium]
MERKLHIGGKQKAEGWEILNANAGPDVDHACNAIDLNIFEDNTFAKVYASHVLEHFDYMQDLTTALNEWNRVLVSKGTIYISVPDLDILAGMLCDKENYSLKDRFGVMRMIFGGHVDQYDYHQVGLNLDFLTAYLVESGFENVKRHTSFGLFQDTSEMTFNGVPISLNVTATKK